MERSIAHRQGLAASARVLQARRLLSSRIAIEGATVIAVFLGSKMLRWDGHELSIGAGEIVAVATGQTFDVLNVPCETSGTYEARWLNFSAEWLAQQPHRAPTGKGREVMRLPEPGQDLLDAFSRACDAMHPSPMVPEPVASARLLELLMWLGHHGVGFSPSVADQFTLRIRHLINANLASEWTAAEVAQRLSVSEATLRRRLVDEGTHFQKILIDTRMSHALTLLQVTDKPVTAIAYDVGYGSPSRFTARFRERFGYVPTDVRSAAVEAEGAQPSRPSVFAGALSPSASPERMPRSRRSELPTYAISGPD